MRRLESLVKRLKKAGKLDDYDAIIKEQLQEGIIEEVPLAATGQEFYIPTKLLSGRAAKPGRCESCMTLRRKRMIQRLL